MFRFFNKKKEEEEIKEDFTLPRKLKIYDCCIPKKFEESINEHFRNGYVIVEKDIRYLKNSVYGTSWHEVFAEIIFEKIDK